MNVEISQILDSIIADAAPPDVTPSRVIIGLFSTYVAAHRGAGIASTVVAHGPDPFRCSHDAPPGMAGMLETRTLSELAGWLHSDNTLEASVGMAAVNCCLGIDHARCREVNAYSIIEEKGADMTVAVIGGFPFIKKLENVAKKVLVFERLPLGGNELPPDRIPRYLPEADVVVITGTSLINHTLGDILKDASVGSYKIILGPSTPMTEALFDFGIDAVCGSMVVDREKVEKYVSQGATFRHVQGVRHLAMVK